MANALYDKGREGFLAGDIAWDTDDIRVVLVDVADYVVNLAVDDNLDDILAAARVAVSGSLTGKTVTAGVADADNPVFTGAAGDVSEALVIYKHTGVETTSRLIAYIDDAGGLPVIPNGGDINVTWAGAPNFIFKL